MASLELVSKLPTDWKTKPLALHKSNTTATLDTLTGENIVGITGEGVRTILNNWATYKDKGWVKNLVIPPTDTSSENYGTVMKDQVDAVAALYDAMLEKKGEGVPKFTATFTEKLTWGMANVDTLKDLTTEKVLGWISSGLNANDNSQGK